MEEKRKKEWKDSLQKLSENEALSFEFKDLYEKNPEDFAQNSLELLSENGIEFSHQDLEEEMEISLEELEQVAGGFTPQEREKTKRNLYYLMCRKPALSRL